MTKQKQQAEESPRARSNLADLDASGVSSFFTILGSCIGKGSITVKSVVWQQAEQQIALSDGAVCLEKFLKTYFPKAVLILDFFHAAEHLSELARAIYPQDEDYRQAWSHWRRMMKEQGGRAVLAQLEQLDRTGWSAEAQETHRREVGYFRNNVARMDYPTYLVNGWRIGSGPIEAACKTVIGTRMKGVGMRWKPPATDAIATLRAAYLSQPNRWDEFWNASYLQT